MHHNRLLHILTLVVLATARLSAAERDFDPQSPRLRFTDPVIRAAMTRGLTSSPTFRSLVDRLVASDLIIYVERETAAGPAHGFTQFVGRTPPARYVRIVVEGQEATDGFVGLLGHELRHALELAEAPWVVDHAGYAALYRKIGRASCAPPRSCFDTTAAVSAGLRIFRELRRGRPSRRAATAEE